MDEALVRGLIIGGALGVVGLIAHWAWKLLRSPSEAARRARIVLGLIGAALIGLVILNAGNDAPFLMGMVAVIGAVVWVLKGRNT